MTKRLENKVALITAAAQGIGRSAAILFAAEGAHVIAIDINREGLMSLQAEIDCEVCYLDVTNRTDINALAKKTGAIDILFNCVGWVHSGTILDCDSANWQRAFDLNVSSVYHMIQSFLPAMISAGGGSIVNMASVAGSIKAVPNRFAYGMTKAAIIGITKSVAADFVSQGIRCNAICPGTVNTPSLEERLQATGDYENTKAAFIARQPMGRIGTAKEIAELALYLAGDASSYTTGVSHVIDGGWCN